MEKRRAPCNLFPLFPHRARLSESGQPPHRNLRLLAIAGIVAGAAFGCGYAGSPPSSSPPSQPSNVAVSIQPDSANLFLGATQQFQASVAGTTNTGVTWEVNGAVNGNATFGAISATGLYSAPTILPIPSSVTVTAVSSADAAATGSATVTLEDDIAVTISPLAATVPTAGGQVFTATVSGSGSPATGITWSVNGIAGGNTIAGTIVAGGSGTALYTAPATPPSPSTVSVTATSVADNSKLASASVTVTCATANAVSPAAATVAVGNSQTFTASFCVPAGTAIVWDVNGTVGGTATIGTIAVTGKSTALYTAPANLPPANPVTIHATAGAASASSSITVTCPMANTVSPAAASVALGSSQSFTASFCVPAGTVIVWDVNGTVGGSATVGTITITGPSTTLYTAPIDPPPANPITIHATAGTAIASSTVTVTSSVAVSISPPSATFIPMQRGSFAAIVANTPDATVTWSVNGVPDGNSVVGQVCISGSNPCAAPPGPAAGSINYVAPSSVPAADPVALVATSHADPSKSGASIITIAGLPGPVSVAISPPYAFLQPSGAMPSTLQFFATVSGGNANVTWTAQSAVAGKGCAGAACGSISATGLYSAPNAAPSPNAISVTATSQADATKFASAIIAITNGPIIEKILPSSIIAGAVESIPFEVQGVNFVAGSGSAASSILLNGAPRTTTCPNSTVCTMALSPIDVQAAGTLTIQVQNPAPGSALSNPVPFVIVPFDVSVDTISLSSMQASAAGVNVIVTEPTSAAVSSPINVEAVGYFTGGNTCGVQGSPLTITRPSSGFAIASICILGNGLDPSFNYMFTAPGAPPGASDISATASSAVTGLFPGMIELDLQISNFTVPGVRTLFITILDNDRAVATGFLEVK